MTRTAYRVCFELTHIRADCSTSDKSWERTAVALQAISQLYTNHANTALLHTHELLKETSDPQARLASLNDLHNAALLSYNAIDSRTADANSPEAERNSQSVRFCLSSSIYTV